MGLLQSWEFLFAANLLAALALPWGLRWTRNEKILLLVLFLAPAALATLSHPFFKADLDFHLKLCVLHWDTSLLCLYFLWTVLPPEKKMAKYYGFLFLSLAVSIGKYLFSPSMVF